MRYSVFSMVICLALATTACTKASNNINEADLLVQGEVQLVHVYEDINMSTERKDTIKR